MVGLGVQGIGILAKGTAAKQHGDAVKAEDDRSAEAAERAAGDAIYRGEIQEMQVAMQGSKVIAAQRVIQSGTGADVNVGGTKATQEATQAVSNVDRKMVVYNAAMHGYGLRVRARGFRQAGANAKAEGDNAMVGTFLSGLGTIGRQAGKVASDIRIPDEESSRPSETDFDEQGI